MGKTNERALEIFRAGRNCAQAVYAANHEIAGTDEATAEAAANGLGAGIGRLQRTCGAVTGGVLAIGHAEWDASDSKGSKERAYAKVRDFVAEFELRNGSSDCLRLLGINLADTELTRIAVDISLVPRRCEPLVSSACDILAEMYPRD